MILFKYYMKIVNRYKFLIFIPTFIFVFFAIFNSKSGLEENEYNLKELNLAFINRTDEDTSRVEKYLKSITNVVELKDDKTEIKDSLFIREVNYILFLEEDGFSRLARPDSTNAFIFDQQINNFLNTEKFNEKIGTKVNIENFSKNDVKIVKEEKENPIKNRMRYYFNFLVYGMLGSILGGISYVMITFNDPKVFQRTIVSSYPYKKYQSIFFGLHFILGIMVFAIITGISLILFKDYIGLENLKYHILNTFVFATTSISIGFFVGNITKKHEVASAINNVVPLGLSFISGAFVPQEFLNSSIQKVAQFTPSYWFVLNNDNIAKATNLGIDKISQGLLIQFLFTIVFIVLGLVVSKEKSKNKLEIYYQSKS